MNGSISLESKINNGTVFTVRLPGNILIKPNNLNNKKSNNVRADSSMDIKQIEEFFSEKDKLCLLLVEDDLFSRMLTETYLNDYFNVESTANGDEAVQSASINTYSVILMDINLGKAMNGIETTKKIRELSGYNEIPIIAFTAYAMAGDKEIFLSSGFTHYISKPFTRKDLYQVIMEALREGK